MDFTAPPPLLNIFFSKRVGVPLPPPHRPYYNTDMNAYDSLNGVKEIIIILYR